MDGYEDYKRLMEYAILIDQMFDAKDQEDWRQYGIIEKKARKLTLQILETNTDDDLPF